jgi:hypothetical protein
MTGQLSRFDPELTVSSSAMNIEVTAVVINPSHN